jgi:thymidylate kinase
MKPKLMLKNEERIIAKIVNPNYQLEDIRTEDRQKLIKKFPIDFLASNRLVLLFNENIQNFPLENFKIEVKKKREGSEKIIKEAIRISEVLDKAGVEHVIIKSVAKSVRVTCEVGDIDLLIREKDFDRAEGVVLKMGCTLLSSSRTVKTFLTSIGVKVEIYNEIYSVDLKFLAEEFIENRVKIGELYVSSSENELIINATRSMLFIDNFGLSLHDILYIRGLLTTEINLLYITDILDRTKGIKPLFFYYLYLVAEIYKLLYNTTINSSLINEAEKFCKRDFFIKAALRITKIKKLPYNSRFMFRFWFLYSLFRDVVSLQPKEAIKAIRAATETTEKIKRNKNKKEQVLIISLSGMDGTGKSTHAKALKEKLNHLGIPCEVVWTRWRPFISYPFMGLVYVLKRYRRKDYHKSKILRKIWAYLTILDFDYIYLFKMKTHLFKGRVVICDRYIHDHIAELMHDGIYNENAVKLLLKLIPNPDISFIFDVPVNTAMMRKNNTQDVLNSWKFEENAEEYLSEQRQNYLEVANSLRIPVMDSTKEFNELNEEIFKMVMEVYKNKGEE